MLSPKDIHDLEQGMQEFKDYFIPTLKTFFEGLIENGFTREESFRLTEEYMLVFLSRAFTNNS